MARSTLQWSPLLPGFASKVCSAIVYILITSILPITKFLHYFQTKSFINASLSQSDLALLVFFWLHTIILSKTWMFILYPPHLTRTFLLPSASHWHALHTQTDPNLSIQCVTNLFSCANSALQIFFAHSIRPSHFEQTLYTTHSHIIKLVLLILSHTPPLRL